jgi:hypothetical protein
MLADVFSIRPYTLSIGNNLSSGVRRAEYAKAKSKSKNLKRVWAFASALSHLHFVLQTINAEIKSSNTNRCGFNGVRPHTGE